MSNHTELPKFLIGQFTAKPTIHWKKKHNLNIYRSVFSEIELCKRRSKRVVKFAEKNHFSHIRFATSSLTKLWIITEGIKYFAFAHISSIFCNHPQLQPTGFHHILTTLKHCFIKKCYIRIFSFHNGIFIPWKTPHLEVLKKRQPK